jgi:hypothetical protein
MTSLLITSQSKERPFVLLHGKAIFSQSTARSPVHHVASMELSLKKFLTEDGILPELLSDNLSHVPEDIFSDSESDSDDSVRERKTVRPKESYSERQVLRKVTIVMVLQMRG